MSIKELLQSHTDSEIIESITSELIRTHNEIRCARGDLNKATSRLNFCIEAIKSIKELQSETRTTGK